MRQFYQWLRNELYQGAIVLTWGKGLISETITKQTHGGPSHVRMALEGTARYWVGTEMTTPCARYWTPYDIRPDELYGIEIGRHKRLSSVSRRRWAIALHWIERMVIQQLAYDKWELIAHLTQELGLATHDWSDKDRTVCSSYVGQIHDIMGIPFKCAETDELLSPYDIWMDEEYERTAALDEDGLKELLEPSNSTGEV
jgi:hypothetical protein